MAGAIFSQYREFMSSVSRSFEKIDISDYWSLISSFSGCIENNRISKAAKEGVESSFGKLAERYRIGRDSDSCAVRAMTIFKVGTSSPLTAAEFPQSAEGRGALRPVLASDWRKLSETIFRSARP